MSGEIQPLQTVVRPMVTAEGAKRNWMEFEELKKSLLIDDDYQAIQDKKYIKRSGLRKLAVAFNLSDRILREERIDREDGSFMWRIVVEVTAPNGRLSTGVGICDSKERKFAHIEHDVYSIAHTRSKNRGISDMIAGGAVSAEEVASGGKTWEEHEAEPEQETRKEETAIPRSLDELDYRLADSVPDFNNNLVVTETKEGFKVTGFKVICKRYLENEVWQQINNVIKSLGGSYVSAGKDSHWLIPAEAGK